MKSRPIPFLLVLIFLSGASYFAFVGISPTSTAEQEFSAATGGNDMQLAAQAFLASLSEKAKSKTLFSLEDEERQNFNFVPMARKGLPLSEMGTKQHSLCLSLLQTGLSGQGYRKAAGIIAWEDILSGIEGRTRGNGYRDPELYYLAIFGEPAAGKPWGWRFEGHQLSLNYTSATGKLAVTPHFMGANPAEVPSGPQKGARLMAAEEDLARRLIQSFDEAQHRQAVISDRAFPEILTGNDRVASLARKEGLPGAAMLEEQQELFDMLINVYLDRMKPEVAQQKRDARQREGIDNVYFAWAGGTAKGQPHYYRVQSGSFLIEYDNTQNNANHIHTVWRDFKGDFGRDLLQEHYKQGH